MRSKLRPRCLLPSGAGGGPQGQEGRSGRCSLPSSLFHARQLPIGELPSGEIWPGRHGQAVSQASGRVFACAASFSELIHEPHLGGGRTTRLAPGAARLALTLPPPPQSDRMASSAAPGVAARRGKGPPSTGVMQHTCFRAAAAHTAVLPIERLCASDAAIATRRTRRPKRAKRILSTMVVL
jgi:hypothetical protein